MHQATLWGTAAVTRPEVFESPADVVNKLVDQLVEEKLIETVPIEN